MDDCQEAYHIRLPKAKKAYASRRSGLRPYMSLSLPYYIHRLSSQCLLIYTICK